MPDKTGADGAAADTPSYGHAAGRLEAILETIEGGRVDIDELSGLVSEAATLVKLCRDKIQAAEMQVRRITEDLERPDDSTPPAPAPAPPPSPPASDWAPPAATEDDLPF